MSLTLYKTATCPKCKVLCAKMDQKGLKYDVCMDIEEMEKLNISSVPVLKVDGELLNFKDATTWVNNL
jgi:glutaredoxin